MIGPAVYTTWAIGVVELDMLIELVPSLLPAPDGTAVHSTAVGYHLKR